MESSNQTDKIFKQTFPCNTGDLLIYKIDDLTINNRF